jgi:MBOAT, membrane-bound O-acyltransferase family
MILARLGLALAVAVLSAAAFFPALALDRWKRAGVLLAVYVPILLSPLLIPARPPFVRFLASLNAVALFVKLYDLHVDAGHGRRPTWWTFVAFLPNWASIVLRKLDDEPRPTGWVNLGRFAGALVGLAAGGAALVGLFLIDWQGWPFALEHAAKVVTLYLALIPGAAALVALWRLAGGKARDFMDHPYLARTPADFWRRYNRPAQQFFYEDVFKPAGGLRSPLRATLLTFAVSALIHEYVFGIVIGRVQGYQTVFFMLQGCATAATERVKPRGWYAIPWIAGTLAFNLASSVFFFASVNGLVPFYSRGLPPWLQGW